MDTHAFEQTPAARRGAPKRLLRALITSTAVLALTGCGSSASHSATSPRTVIHTVTSASPPTSTAAATQSNQSGQSGQSTPTVQARAANASVGPACRPAKITISVGQSAAGLGHVGEPLLFHNAGSGTCVLTGYPGVELVRPGGSLEAARTPNGYLGGLSAGSKRAPVLRVRPGRTVSALLEGLDSRQPGGGPCPAYRALLVTPPNFTLTTRLAGAPSICMPTVHPVVAGATGEQHS